MPKEIPLTKGRVTLVDDIDFDRFASHKWHYGSRGYAVRRVTRDGKPGFIYLHREIAGDTLGMFVDHANGDPLDNRRENLRLCTNSQNQQNRRAVQGVSKYKGVTWHKSAGKWQAQIKVDGRNVYLGLFGSEADAAQAYADAAHQHFGEFAFANASTVEAA